ncbi:MAG TPA: hypothetical protein VHJ39_08855 [Solirubrobacteraceae bacterium]|nr:hypothetical protein [Solirubrobacteraceae bacterium]
MSTVGLFALGVVVTLIVGAGLALLVLGAVLDGRDEAQRKSAETAGMPALHPSTSLAPATVATGVPAAQTGVNDPNRRTT